MKHSNAMDRKEMVGDQGSLPPKARAIQSMFSSIARRYDLLNHLLSFGMDFGWRRRTVRHSLNMALQTRGKAEHILDVCCGTGDLTLAFAKSLGVSADVSGADFSHEMVELAVSKSRNITHSTSCAKIHFVQGDALRLPFPDACFDIVSVAFGLRNFIDRTAGIREMARVVGKGGVVAILEFSQPNPWLRPFYHIYLHRVLPRISRLFSRYSAYRYLADTVSAFAAPDEVSDWMCEAGLSNVGYIKISQGIVVLHTGKVS